MPEKTILISPWLDTRLTNPKIPEVQKRDKQLNKFKLQIAALGYAGKDEGVRPAADGGGKRRSAVGVRLHRLYPAV